MIGQKLENCHYKHIEKNDPPTGGHVFLTDLDHFQIRQRHQLNQLFTRKTAPPTGGHVFQQIGTTFELNQDIIKTNILTNVYKFLTRHNQVSNSAEISLGQKLLTKFHEDVTNVASRVFTSKCLRTEGRTYDGQRPVTKAHLSNQFHEDCATHFHEKYEELLKFPQDPEKCDRLTDTQKTGFATKLTKS
ncbi:hypothetical protein DPMN_141171 [Dreissena polymorpha]|uniref:Uncharacterized protein n=1 Tax=Dreissena polymorpha TaxID=45954 RepID=A0A9D4JL13_DREPO|nr:hypothetical protein DPMN_141171 [Dreissena polymorpha]